MVAKPLFISTREQTDVEAKAQMRTVRSSLSPQPAPVRTSLMPQPPSPDTQNQPGTDFTRLSKAEASELLHATCLS